MEIKFIKCLVQKGWNRVCSGVQPKSQITEHYVFSVFDMHCDFQEHKFSIYWMTCNQEMKDILFTVCTYLIPVPLLEYATLLILKFLNPSAWSDGHCPHAARSHSFVYISTS